MNNERIEIRDNRRRILLGAIARNNGEYCFACCACDADFLSAESCQNHIETVHGDIINEYFQQRLTVNVLQNEDPTQNEVKAEPELNATNGEDENMDIIYISSTDDEDDKNDENNNSKSNQTPVQQQTNSSSDNVNVISSADAVQSQVQNDKYGNPNLVNDGASTSETQSKRSTNRQSIESSSSSVSSVSIESKESNSPTNSNHAEANGADFDCKHCQACFKQPIELVKHKKHCKKWQSTIFKCRFCSNEYSQVQSLRKHIIDKHSASLKRCICEYCPSWFRTHQEMNEHIQQKHCSGSVVPCHFCKEEFLTAYARNNHVKKTHSSWAFFDEVVCPLCQHSFKSKEKLREHTYEVHEKPMDE